MPGSTDSKLIVAQLMERAIARLQMGGEGLIRKWADYGFSSSRHIVRQAFETIGVHAVFGFAKSRTSSPVAYSPILYFAIAFDDKDADRIHRLVWSQGVVPLLLIATPGGLQIRKSLGPPTAKPVSISWDKLDGSAIPVELTSLTSTALASSVVWGDFMIDRSARVDNALLTAIKALNKTVCDQFPELDDRPVLVNSVIGRFIYLFILIDRGVVTPGWMNSLRNELGQPLCPTIAKSLVDENGADDSAWPAREVWELFDCIDGVLNGTIFPIKATERRIVPSKLLHLVRRVIRHGDQLEGGRQLGFLNVSFATLRTETISAIYELFLLIESPDAKDEDGAFYTPPYLVDYVLDEVDRIRPFGASSRILDPAAGSGIFLVGAYRRVIERSLRQNRWKAAHFQKARALLESCIFGIERNPQAANVARFSLYLTLLDYVQSASIVELRKLAGRKKVFPPLDKNVLDQDVFTIESAPNAYRYSHVVGNPPWGTFGAHSGRTNIKRTADADEQRTSNFGPALAFYEALDGSDHPVANKRLSELFIWKIKCDLLKANGVMGVLISTRSFVARTAASFPSALAKQMKLVGVANLSHFRYRLFSGARSPALAVFAEAKRPDPIDTTWVYSPLLSSQPIGQRGHLWSIVVSALDIEHYRVRDFARREDAWFEALMLRPIDRRFYGHLKLWAERRQSSLSHFIRETGFAIGRGGSPSQTGIPKGLLLGATDYMQKLGIGGLGFANYDHEKLQTYSPSPSFERMFAGNIVLIPRHMNEIFVVEKPIAFGSSFNAIYSKAVDGRKATAAMAAIARFLNSKVARYMYALYGKTWILDRTRLEKNDLCDIPFPFADSANDIVNMGDDHLTKLFAAKIGLEKTFVDCVEEYSSFRNGYEDAQIPEAGLGAPSAASVAHYKLMLDEQLSIHFGQKASLQQEFRAPSDEKFLAQISIHIGRKVDQTERPEGMNVDIPVELPSRFSPLADISFDLVRSQVSISKPWTRVAWTIEQAFSDARAISEEIFRAGA